MAIDNQLRIRLEAQSRRFKERGKRFSIPRPPVHVSTNRIEEEYSRALIKILKGWQKTIKEHIIPQLPSIVEEAELERNRSDSRMDINLMRKLKAVFESTSGLLETFEIAQIVRDQITQTVGKISSLSQKNLAKGFKKSLGLDIETDSPLVSQQMEIFTEVNVDLIKDLREGLMKDIEQVVVSGVRRGERASDMVNKILARTTDKDGFKGRFKKAETRARFIARDQVQKLNGAVNQARQQSIGVEKYTWRTARDERVRDSHQLDGEVFTWKGRKSENGRVKPRGGLNPGEDFQCRCYAEPYLEDLIE